MMLPTLILAMLLPVATDAAKPVRVVSSADSWRLDNGLVEVGIDKRRAVLIHLSPSGGPELVDLGYYDTNGRPGGLGKQGYERFGRHVPVIAKIAGRNDEMVDLMFVTDPSKFEPERHHPLFTELHYVLRRGEPGFYVYWLRRHESGMPAFDLVQTRYVIRASRRVFDRWRISDQRGGAFPAESAAATAKKVYDATFQLPDGRYLTKYANAMSVADYRVAGVFSTMRRVGLWIVPASTEYINGGPTKQILTVHQLQPILLHMAQSTHFGAAPAHVEGNWDKLYGPVFVYINRAETPGAAWADARARAALERSRWPYPWVAPRTAPSAYPLRRGGIGGRVVRTDGGAPAGAFVVLGAAQPEWPLQSSGYLWWTRTGADGRFQLRHVRPGRYTLYVFQPGVFGETRRDGVTLRADRTTEVGRIALADERHGRQLWQIGVPDRSAAEYRHGDEYRQVYLHRRYAHDFPSDVHFVVGKSREAQDWNYYQPGGRTWTVAFDLAKPLQRPARLTVALAAAGYRPPATLIVAVNGMKFPPLRFEPGDNALWRLGIRDRYQVRTIVVPAGRLRTGPNTLTLTLPSRRMWVMYDFLRLEAGKPRRQAPPVRTKTTRTSQ